MSESVEPAKTVKFKAFPKGMLFDEYRLFVEDTARFSDRRQAFSNFMVVANGFLVTGICTVLKDFHARPPGRLLLVLPLLAAGLAAACLWRKVFIEYDDMIDKRVDFLRRIEGKAGKGPEDGMYHMLDAKVYQKDIATADRAAAERRRRGFTRLEKWLPCIFIGVYSSFAACVVLVGLRWLCFMFTNCLYAVW